MASKTVNGKKFTVYSSLPKGWKRLSGATTAPKGYIWIYNGKSRFGGGYKKTVEDEMRKKSPAIRRGFLIS